MILNSLFLSQSFNKIVPMFIQFCPVLEILCYTKLKEKFLTGAEIEEQKYDKYIE